MFSPLLANVRGRSSARLAPFLQHLRQLYRRDNNYHNFQHALDVLQATYYFLLTAGVVPSVSILETDSRLWKPDKRAAPGSLISSLSNADIFALYIAAIGHDVGHPGLTNAFMVCGPLVTDSLKTDFHYRRMPRPLWRSYMTKNPYSNGCIIPSFCRSCDIMAWDPC